MTPPWQKIAASTRSAGGGHPADGPGRRAPEVGEWTFHLGVGHDLSPLVQSRIAFRDHVFDRNVEVGTLVEFREVFVDTHRHPELLGSRRRRLAGAPQSTAGDRANGQQHHHLGDGSSLLEPAIGQSGIGFGDTLDPVRQAVPDQDHLHRGAHRRTNSAAPAVGPPPTPTATVSGRPAWRSPPWSRNCTHAS